MGAHAPYTRHPTIVITLCPQLLALCVCACLYVCIQLQDAYHKIHSSSNIRIKELTNRTGGHSCHYLFDGCAKTRTETTHGPNSSHDIKETPVMGNVLPKERPRNFSEAMLEGELQETGCNRNGCNATETCIFSSYSQGIHMPL